MNDMTTRRDVLRSLALTGTGALLAGCTKKKSIPRPNILFIMTDDQTVNEMGCYGNDIIDTPNMDRIAEEGARFTNCFCTNSLCAPSRASILTGCYSSLNGITGNSEKAGEAERLNPAIPTFPELLRKAGYYTTLIGKYHIPQEPRGFDEWCILPGQGEYFNPEFIENGERTSSEGYVTDIITYKVLDFLKRIDRSHPFCLLYQHKAPHRPFTPSPRHTAMYESFEFPYPSTFDDDYASRRIAGLARDMKLEVSLAGDYPDLPGYLTPEGEKRWIFQRMMRDRHSAVYGIDENLGRVLKYLDDQKLADDTLVIYTSDNGFFLGEHGWYDKRFMYEPSIRIPLLIRYPRGCIPGVVNEQTVLNVDIAPTILDYAGVPIPVHMHGKSLRAQMEGRRPMAWRQSMYYAYYENSWRLAGFKQEDLSDPGFKYFTAHRVGPHHGIRTKHYKLIEYYGEGDYWELFDLDYDPDELENVYTDPDYKEIVQYQKDELRSLEQKYGIPGKT